MKIEDIEKAAQDYDDGLIYSSVKEQCDVIKAFKAGAKWRINSVWHDVKENPTERKIIIALSRDGCMTECDFTYDHRIFTWIDIVKSQNVIKWCYKEDILPDTEE